MLPCSDASQAGCKQQSIVINVVEEGDNSEPVCREMKLPSFSVPNSQNEFPPKPFQHPQVFIQIKPQKPVRDGRPGTFRAEDLVAVQQRPIERQAIGPL